MCLNSTLFSGPAMPESCWLLTEAGLHLLKIGEFYTATMFNKWHIICSYEWAYMIILFMSR